MLNLDGAVTIHPLTPEQIKNYLIAAEAPQLQNLLDNDEALKEMARSPLELSIMVLARDNTEFKALLSPKISSITTKRKALFDVYVKTMVQREQLKRKKCPDLHDSDYAKISVSDDHLLRLNKNLGLIARMLCVNSRIAYRPGRLYDYLTTNEATFLNDDVLDEKLSRKPINIVNKAILLLGLGILTLCYCNRYPILLFMFLIPLFLNNYLLGISDMKFKNEKIKSLVPVLWGWLVAMVFFPFCYWPIDYLIFRWPPLFGYLPFYQDAFIYFLHIMQVDWCNFYVFRFGNMLLILR
jgi:hypothetical protein